MNQTQEIKDKEAMGDPGGQDAQSGRYSSRSGLCPPGENLFLLINIDAPQLNYGLPHWRNFHINGVGFAELDGYGIRGL